MARRARGRANITEAEKAAAAHYREYAAQIRILADGEANALLRDRLRAIVEEYEARAAELDPPP